MSKSDICDRDDKLSPSQIIYLQKVECPRSFSNAGKVCEAKALGLALAVCKDAHSRHLGMLAEMLKESDLPVSRYRQLLV